jgi:Rhs element Vgr protein
MANSTTATPPPSGVVTFSIVAGSQTMTEVDGPNRVQSLTITKGINTISKATVELLDGDPSTGTFKVADADTFKPGTAIQISVGYNSTNTQLFDGIVTGLAVAAQEGQGARLTVSCQAGTAKLAGMRQTRTFPDQSVSDTITAILGDHPDLGMSTTVADTSDVETGLIQYNRTDWDYIVSRAESQGQVVISDQKTFTTLTPSTAGTAALVLEYGTNVYSFALQVDARPQLGGVTAQSWSLDEGQSLTATAATPSLTTPGNLTTSDLSAVLGQTTYTLYATGDVGQPLLQKMADSYLARRTLAKVQGTVDISGTNVLPGSLVSLSQLGQRFDGTALVAQVTHTVGEGKWRTQLRLGLDEQWFAERRPDVAPPAEALSAIVGGDGLCKAVVKAIQPDADNKFRVQVTINDFVQADLWARLAQPYATADAGMYFYPEVGDQVVVGFLGGATNSPVILGSLYSKNRAPAYTPDDKNSKKAIVTNSKLTLEFDDDQKIITLKTPAGNKLVISDADGGKGFALTDQQNNTITMSDQGVSIVSKSTLSLKADQDITLESTGGNVTIKATQDVKAEGLNVSASADAALTLKGTATAELSASGNTTVKGIMVMIN